MNHPYPVFLAPTHPPRPNRRRPLDEFERALQAEEPTTHPARGNGWALVGLLSLLTAAAATLYVASVVLAWWAR